MTELEILTVGRISVDLYAQRAGPIEEAHGYVQSVGGTATNVAVAAARLGRRAAVLTRVGSDPFGDYVRHKLESFGVDTRFVGTDPELRTPLAFAVLDPPDDPHIIFYREPEAPDMRLDVGDVDLGVVASVPILWVTGSRFSAQPSRSTVTELLRHRARRTHTVLDLDWRPTFWDSPSAAGAAIRPALDLVTVAVGNRTECEVVVGTSDPDEAADRLLEHGVAVAIVKLGGDGVLTATPDERVVVAAKPVDVVCGLGAGDAFGGALCHGLLEGWEPEHIARYANVAGAIVAGRLLCSDDMPTAAEIDELLAS